MKKLNLRQGSAGWLSAFVVAIVAGFVSVPVWAAYTDKSYHDAGEHTYKHPHQRSFTSPFDYGVKAEPRVAPEPRVEPGKCNSFTFDATKSFDVDGQKLSVAWDFGDGTTSDKPVVNKTYDKAGDYNVTLTVRDSSGMVCDSGIASTKVSANFPPTCAAGEDKSACVGETISFDASASTSSGPATYRWDFGDGETAEGMRVTHAYQKAGTYRVVLTGDDGKGTACSTCADTLAVKVTDAVTVSVEGPSTVCTGRTASFSATGTGGARYLWDFGDGETLEGGSRVSHVYKKGGTYTVTVTADNGLGFACSKDSDSMLVKVSSAPIADAGENLACCVDQSVSFDGSGSTDADGDALSYLWNFGDGETAEGAKVSHTYAKSGQYRVVLTVKDGSGEECSTSSDSFVAVVNTKPEAVIEVR